MEKSEKYLRIIQSVIALTVLVIGLGINWGMTKSELATLKSKHEELLSKIDKAEGSIFQLQLKQAGDDQVLKTLQVDIMEIKKDVKKLLEKGR